MDPNTLLAEIRELTKTADAEEYGANDLYVELAEKFRALDDWLKVGGFLPKSWERSGEAYFLAQHAEDAS